MILILMTILNLFRRFFVGIDIIRLAPICHELDLELVGLVGKMLLVLRFLLLVVEQLPNPILFSIRVLMKFLAEVEVTCML